MILCKKGHEVVGENAAPAGKSGYVCRMCQKARVAAYNAKNRDKNKQYQAEWARENKERLKEAAKARYIKNRDSVLADSAKYYAANKERVKARTKLWHENNPEKTRLADAACRHRRRGLNRFPTKNYKILLEAFGTWCPYCETDGHNLTIDHITPVSKGGDNSIENLMPCCPSCNSSKNGKYIGQWKPQLSFLSLQGDI